MATITNLETTGNNADQTSYATGSITPAANSLVLAWCYSIAAAAPNVPTATGNSLTWVAVDNILDSDSLRKITLFRAMGGAPTAGSITFDFNSQTQTGGGWSVVQITGTDATGTDGSGAVIQSITAKTTSNGGSLTATLTNALTAKSNVVVGGFGIPLNTAAQPAISNSAIKIGQRNQGTPNLSIGTEYLDNVTALTMNAGAASVPWVSVTVEVKVAGFPNNFQFANTPTTSSFVTEKIR